MFQKKKLTKKNLIIAPVFETPQTVFATATASIVTDEGRNINNTKLTQKNKILDTFAMDCLEQTMLLKIFDRQG